MLALRTLLQFPRTGASGRKSRGGYRKRVVNASDKSTESRIGGERLFSALGEDMKHMPGNWQSAAQLVAGTTVGAGILALPTVTESSGFVPSAVAITGVWLYMVATGLLVAEVNLRTMCELGRGGVSLASMAQRSLGNWGIRVTSASYIFLHYAVLVAYISKGGETLNMAVSSTFAIDAGNAFWGSLFAGGVSAVCLYSSNATLGRINGGLIVAGLAAFGVLLSAAVPMVNSSQLFSSESMHFEYLSRTTPVLALAFVYHNIIPIICTDLEGDRAAIRRALVVGTGGPCLMYLVWNAVVLGFPTAGAGLPSDPVARLIASSQSSLDGSSSSLISTAAASFSLAAVTTSFIGFVLGLSDFFADWMKMPADQGKNLLTVSLSVVPPILLAWSAPGIFIGALDFAGTFGVLTLFGIIPAAMAYVTRYTTSHDTSSYSSKPSLSSPSATSYPDSASSTDLEKQPRYSPMDPSVNLVPGGRVGLALAGGFAGWIIAQDIVEKIAAVAMETQG